MCSIFLGGVFPFFSRNLGVWQEQTIIFFCDFLAFFKQKKKRGKEVFNIAPRLRLPHPPQDVCGVLSVVAGLGHTGAKEPRDWKGRSSYALSGPLP